VIDPAAILLGQSVVGHALGDALERNRQMEKALRQTTEELERMRVKLRELEAEQGKT
jgi:hypothetical protein